MNNNRASGCPKCHKEPVSYLDPASANLYIIECPAHGYMAMGHSLQEAIDNWRTLTATHPKVTGTFSMNAGFLPLTPCPFCKHFTSGQSFSVPERFYIECAECRHVKDERATNPKINPNGGSL